MSFLTIRADSGRTLAGRAPWVSAPGTRGHGGVSGQAARRPPAGFCPGRVGAARGHASPAVSPSPQSARPCPEDPVECAHSGALSSRSRCGHVSGAVPAGRPDQERPPGSVRRRPRHLYLARAARGGRRGASLAPKDDVARGGLSATVAPPCPRAADARGAVVWAVPPDAGEGPRSLPYCARATAGGDAGAADLADGVCLAWGGPSRAVSHLRAAARVHRRDPAWRCAPTGAGWG